MLELMGSMNKELKCGKEMRDRQNKNDEAPYDARYEILFFNKEIVQNIYAKYFLEAWQVKKCERICVGNGQLP